MTTAGTSPPTAKPGSLDEQLLSPAFLQDPYPTHRRLRREDPVHWCEPWRMWMVSRYEDVRTVLLKDGTTFSAVGQTSAALAHLSSVEHSQLESLQRIFSAGLLWSDPPDHTRIRSAVNKALTPHDAERMRPRLDGIIASVVDELPVGEAFDFVERVAAPVPVSVLAALLGIRDEDVPRFRAWADTLAAFIGSPRPTADLALAAQACVLEAGEFIGWLRERRRREPTDDVITRLVTEPRATDALTDDEFTATIIVLLVGGHRTTTALIASSILALAHHPDQERALRGQPSLITTAVEEFLRFEGPHQRTIRIAREDSSIGDRPVATGEVVALRNGAANRDPDQFPDADDLRLDRTPNRHLALSAGLHFCIGAPLARLEGASAVTAMLRRFSRLEVLEDEPSWLENYTLGSLTRLTIRGS